MQLVTRLPLREHKFYVMHVCFKMKRNVYTHVTLPITCVLDLHFRKAKAASTSDSE